MQPHDTHVVRDCARCGIPFFAPIQNVKNGYGDYCSRQCAKGSAEFRFWNNVTKTDDCWEWTAGKTETGYGRFRVHGRMTRVHRFSWEIHHGPIPEDMDVLHKCDNPPCVNPSHLFLGTQTDNNHDMYSKGRGRKRGVKGESSHLAKLTATKVLAIRARLAQGEKQQPLADEFNVSRRLVGKIKRRQVWAHL